MTIRTTFTPPARRAALLLLVLVLAGLAALAANHVYQNHIATECGAECGGTASRTTMQGGF